jgi:alkylation response protein AidB-like acyl-CoA dehydrogenase
MLDRALVVVQPAQSDSDLLLVEVELDRTQVWADLDSWQADGMAGSDTLDVQFTSATVDRTVGDAGWYTRRPGFAAGGGGVAAVWLGGAAGLLDRASAYVAAAGADPHQLAHLGELHAMLAASQALLRATAGELDALPDADHGLAIATVRSATELCCRAVVDRVPRILGPSLWSGDAHLAEMLADLQMYVRQHHGERDNAALASVLLRMRAR